jgi:hypothetical protein
MNVFLDYLIKISPLLLALLTGFLVLLTGFYAWYTRTLVNFSKKPKVYLNIGFRNGYAVLIVENFGQTAAKDFELKSEIKSEKSYKKYPGLQKLEDTGIDYISPQTKLSIPISSIKKTELYDTKVSLIGKFSYTDEDKNKHVENFDLFLNFYLNQDI